MKRIQHNHSNFAIYGGLQLAFSVASVLSLARRLQRGITLLVLGVVVAVLVLMQLMGVSKHTHKKER